MTTTASIARRIAFGSALFGLIIAWELTTRDPRVAFLLGRPSTALAIVWLRLWDGTLVLDAIATLVPLLSGFLFGNLVGVVLGLALWRFADFGAVARPFLVALGAVPVFVLGPVLIVWFGTGVTTKVLFVVLSTVLTAAFQTQAGANAVDRDFFLLFRSVGAQTRATFFNLILPSAAPWVFNALKMNVGFSLLGIFIAEFVSSERGIAHRALVDAGLYNLSGVWAGALCVAVMAVVFSWLVGKTEQIFLRWKGPSNVVSF